MSSSSASLADAAATSIGNLIQYETDLKKGVEFAKRIDGIFGVLIIIGEKMAAWGNVTLVEI